MIITFNKTEIKTKSKIRKKLESFLPTFRDISKYYNEDEIFSFILSTIRTNEMNIVNIEETKNRTKYYLDVEKIKYWIETRLVQNTIQIGLDDKEFLSLLIFSLAMPYKMLKGETSATKTEKVRRGKERDFEQIFSDTFIGKIGEVIFKQFAKQKFEIEISLDWEISKEIEKYKSDIVNSRKQVSIKSTDTLFGIWSEAPKNADYGILIKVSLPKDFLMKILAHISSLMKLLNFAKERIQKDMSASNNITVDLINFIKESAYEEEMIIKAFICGFFKTSEETLKKKGNKLNYIGGEFEIYEEKHILKCDELKYSYQDWSKFFKDILD